jgi:threonine synthase
LATKGLFFYTFTDEETTEAMKVIYGNQRIYSRTTWRRGLFRAKKELLNYPNAIGIFLETAHPIKF